MLWTNRGSDIFLYFPLLDDKAPVTDTNIPSHLEQMLDILTQEEGERESGETGPCMEYLLHHKILETLYTLGKADVRQSQFGNLIDLHCELHSQAGWGHVYLCRPPKKILTCFVCIIFPQCPPGMKQQVLTFYTKLLAHIRQPLLPHINVHRPVQVSNNAVWISMHIV